MRRFTSVFMAVLCIISMLTGCSNTTDDISADLSYVQTDISKLSVPESIQVVALGEASHGVKEYQQMKAEIFKALVENNGCRTFIIEGDFGSALKVEDYIHGGNGTAEDAVSEIGFAIYRTQEMADLVTWMRTYNEGVSDGEDLHFYGMDMQRFDNNKEFLFYVLEEAAPQLYEKYEVAFAQLTDEKRLSLKAEILSNAKTDTLNLIKEMDDTEANIVEIVGKSDFDFARECVNSIYECCELQLSSNIDYSTLRDGYMAEKVKWFLKHGDGSVLFTNGHNGHIGKTSVSNYICLGELLTDDLGDAYFAIGTDSKTTSFNSQNENGSFSVVKVNNNNTLNSQLAAQEYSYYYIDFSKASIDANWKKILNSEQKITTLNVSISEFQKLLKSFYTTSIVPQNTFNGMVVFEEVSPTTILEQ